MRIRFNAIEKIAKAKQLLQANANDSSHSMFGVSDLQLSSPTPFVSVAPMTISMSFILKLVKVENYINPSFCVETWLPSVSPSKLIATSLLCDFDA